MPRLVAAHNACFAPHVPAEPPLTLAGFKRDVRDLHVWCSSSMIAMEGSDPIGVLIGAKRPDETLVRRIGVRPDRLRRGHGRHLLASLGAKLAILGPQRIVAEIPETAPGAAAFFEACGFARETWFTDFILERPARAGHGGPAGQDLSGPAVPPESSSGAWFVIPATVGDLIANGLLTDPPVICWERAAATLRSREDLLEGLALASAERIAGYALFRRRVEGPGAVIAALRAPDGPTLLRLAGALAERVGTPLSLPRAHPEEIPPAWLEEAGFRAAGSHIRYTAKARPG